MKTLKPIALALTGGFFSILLSLQTMAAWPQNAFLGENINQALDRLYQNHDTNDTNDNANVTIIAPEIAENGAVVPVRIKTNLKDVQSVSLLVADNPYPLAANFVGNSPQVSTRLKFRATTTLLAVVQAGGKLHTAQKKVKVTIGGCGGSSDTSTPGMTRSGASLNFTSDEPVKKLSNTIKVKAAVKQGKAKVKLLLSHPMETGLRKSKTGKSIPAHFIKRVVARHNGKVVMTANWGIAVSKNPYLSFDLNGVKKGDAVEIEWSDNRNMTDTKKISL